MATGATAGVAAGGEQQLGGCAVGRGAAAGATLSFHPRGRVSCSSSSFSVESERGSASVAGFDRVRG